MAEKYPTPSAASISLVNALQNNSLVDAQECLNKFSAELTSSPRPSSATSRDDSRTNNHGAVQQSYLNETLIEGIPVIHYAIRGLRSLDFVQLLLRHGADSNALHDGEQPLHAACTEGLSEIVLALLQAGADINATNKRGRTPLYLAIIFDHTLIVQILLGRRAEQEEQPVVVDASGTTQEAKRALVSVRDEHETALHVACKLNKLDLVQRLATASTSSARIQQHALSSIDCRNASGQTPLHYACLHGHEAIASYLIQEHGANATLKDEKGKSCLHHACFSGSSIIVKMLLEKDHVDINAQTTDFG